jgi:large subunit ribosomal protein L29
MIMTGDEVRQLADEEISLELGRLRERIFTLRTQTVTEKVEDNSQFRNLRRDVARLETERRRRELEKAVS